MAVDLLAAYNRTFMKRILLSLALLVFACSPRVYETPFDYAQVWEQVYRFELQGLPKSASQKVDSIYIAAGNDTNAPQRIKSVIYQSKFLLLLEEGAQQRVITKLKTEIETSPKPVSNILEGVLARSYLSYYYDQRYKISRRTPIKNPDEDFMTWDQTTFLMKIGQHFTRSIDFDSAHIATPVEAYEEIMRAEPDSRIYRPLLIDLLVHDALDFYSRFDVRRGRPAEYFKLDNPDLFSPSSRFLTINLSHPDSASLWLKALRVYQSLTVIHEKYGSDESRINLELNRRSFVHEKSELLLKDSLYLNSLERLKSDNRTHSTSTRIDFTIAKHLDDLGGRYAREQDKSNQFKKAEARQVCLTAIKSFPESFGAGQCAALVKMIERPSLRIQSEKHLLPNTPAKMLINYKQHDQLRFVTYRLSLSQLDSVLKLGSGDLIIKDVSGLEMVQEWTSTLTNESDYQDHSTEVLFPPHAQGAYLVLATSATDHNQLLGSTTAMVTNLALVYDDNDTQRIFRVVNRLNGAAVPGVKVHLKAQRRNSANSFVNLDFVSDENGEFILSNAQTYVDLKISMDDGNEKTVLYDQYLSGRQSEPKAEEKGGYYADVQLFTDRSIYRPGQEVFFKGILIKQLKHGSETVQGEVLFVSLVDGNDKTLAMESFETNEFGSVAGSFKLPTSGITGFYRLKVENNNPDSQFFNKAENFNGTWHGISVEEYKRPRFEVDFEPLEGTFTQNDSIWVKGNALAFAGSNLTNASVKYTIGRKKEYSWAYRSSSASILIDQGEVFTDGQGAFKIPFVAVLDPAVKKSEWPVFVYTVSADITDANGETRTATTEVRAGYHTLNIDLRVVKSINKQAGKAEFIIDAKSLNGSPKQVRGTLNVFKLQGPKYVKRSKPWPGGDYPGFTREEHDKLFPHFPYPAEGLPSSWPRQKRYSSQQIGAENQKVVIDDLSSWPPGQYLVEFISSDSGREIIKTQTFSLIDPELSRLADNERFYIKADRPFYIAGDTAVIRYGTAASDMVVNLTIKKRSGVMEKFPVHLHDEIRTLKIPITKQDEGGFGVLYDYTLFNTSQSGVIRLNVPEQNPSLQITTGTFRNKLTPGAKEQWSFTIRGKEAKRVSAEVLASMYDASLDQFILNPWRVDAFRSNDYWSYHSFRTLASFETEPFAHSVGYPYVQIPQVNFEGINRFGMAFSQPDRLQKQYLIRLGWANGSRLVIGTFRKGIRSGTIQGVVIDERGQPLSGVGVSIVDSRQTVVTDSTGSFLVRTRSGQRIVFERPGYKNLEWPMGHDNYLEVRMLPDMTSPEEMLRLNNQFMDRNASRRFDLMEIPDGEEVYELAFDMEAEEEPGAMQYRASVAYGDWAPKNSDMDLRASLSYSTNMPGLIIIDGVEGDATSLKNGDILSSEQLSPAEAMVIYGEKGIEGALIITTKKGMAAQNALLAKVKTRTNLKETAFFFPQLKTNAQGEVSFEFDSPESLTRWNLQVLAHNKEMASGILKQTVVTQKELMLLPNPPRFFREGDTITFSAKIASLSPYEQKGFAKLELYDELTGQLLESLILNGGGNKSFQLAPKGNTSVSWQLSIPEGLQAIRYKVVAATDDFSDGEENVLPVLSNRMLVQESVPLWASPNTTKTFSLDKLKTQQSGTLKHHNLTLTMTTNPVWEAIQSLPYLMEYPYECAEQTFARYYANSLGSHIVEEFPMIKETFDKWAASGALVSKLEQNQELKALLIEETPWLREAKTMAEQQKRLAMLFESARMEEQLEGSLDKLRKMQLSSGGFPWFSGSDRANLYITQHIISGLVHLQKLTGNEVATDIISQGRVFMNQELIKRYQSKMKLDSLDKKGKWIGFSELQYLYVRSFLKPDTVSEKLSSAIGFFEKEAFEHWLQMDLQSQAMIALYAKRTGQDQKAEQIIASLKEYSLTNEERGTYWKTNTIGWYNWEAPVETQALLIEAFEEITEDVDFVNGMKQWLLSEKRTKSWKSTKATTEAIYALLFSGTDWTAANTSVNVDVGGESVIESSTQEGAPGTGYFKKTWQAEEIEAEMAEVVIENDGSTIAFGGLYWQYFEDLDKITPAMGPLSLEKELFLVANKASGEVLETIDENTQLALGDLVRVRIVLRSDRSMEFIHLKDMRAAGFEPLNVLSGYKWQDGLGYYESTRDAATNFFIEYLPKGTFVFEYDMRVNNEGNFSNGITSIQNMYAPEFSSHSEGIRVTIGNK